MISAAVSVHDLAVEFDGPKRGQMAALGPLSLQVDPGEFVCVVGPSGCGKSTLIRVIAGLLAPTRGRVLINDEVVHETPSPLVGMMFQDANLMPWRTVIDNIALPLELHGVSKGERYEKVNRLLPVLGLEDFSHGHPGELSGGMAQRVALGRVLVQNPSLLLLDEPFGALDALTREQVSQDLMRIWWGRKQTVLMVTHDIHEAVFLSDRVIVMSHRPGRIVADISIDLARPRSINTTYGAAFAACVQAVRKAIETA